MPAAATAVTAAVQACLGTGSIEAWWPKTAWRIHADPTALLTCLCADRPALQHFAAPAAVAAAGAGDAGIAAVVSVWPPVASQVGMCLMTAERQG